jgi:hypothetical protein
LTTGVPTGGVLTRGVLIDGTCTDGVLPTGVRTDGTSTGGVLTDGTVTDGTVTDGTVTDGMMRAPIVTLGVAMPVSAPAVAGARAPAASSVAANQRGLTSKRVIRGGIRPLRSGPRSIRRPAW